MRALKVVVFLSFMGLVASLNLNRGHHNANAVKSDAVDMSFLSTTTGATTFDPSFVTTTSTTPPVFSSAAPLTTTTFSDPVSTFTPGVAERECGCTHSKIWLDIVAVIDNSQTMTQEGISTIQATLDTVVHELTLNVTGGWASRVGVITFNEKATVVADLKTYTSTTDFENQLFTITASTTIQGVNILSGLQAALGLIKDANPGPNRRSVVILFSSAYNNGGYDDPLPMAHQMVSDNIKLITVAFVQRMESSEVLLLSELAYPGFNLTNDQTDLIDAMYDSLCQANCFCPGNWMQFRTNYNDITSRGYGICLYYAGISSGWQPAKLACHGEATGAYLTTEFSKEKHDFNVAYIKDVSQNGEYDYHIGLSYLNGGYVWEQANGQTVPLNNGYSNWNLHFPNNAQGNCVLNTNIVGSIIGWTNEDCWSKTKRYLCQVNTCDTDYYCS
ncbi:hypothetical protein FO519_003405 [Halicephalobus sp. NKZ332]|nr:hypothetical protein FO519_003405 [Halicephalobus sp. NKZ332]